MVLYRWFNGLRFRRAGTYKKRADALEMASRFRMHRKGNRARTEPEGKHWRVWFRSREGERGRLLPF